MVERVQRRARDQQHAGRGELVLLAVEESPGERSGPRARDGNMYLCGRGAGVGYMGLDLIGV
jgi:hypothetical protein